MATVKCAHDPGNEATVLVQIVLNINRLWVEVSFQWRGPLIRTASIIHYDVQPLVDLLSLYLCTAIRLSFYQFFFNEYFSHKAKPAAYRPPALRGKPSTSTDLVSY